MFIEERQKEIIGRLRAEGRITVKELSRSFQVSEDCIRKDLKTLEMEGRLKRTYGGAVMSQDYPLKRDVIDRRDVNLEKKDIIATKALGIIQDGETIFLDISTTNIKLAKLLIQSGKRAVVISNMIDILQILSADGQIPAIGTGGTMVHTVNGFLGAETIEFISHYSFDRAFVGTCGLDLTDGTITTLGAEDGLTKRAIIENSRHKYVIMENDKFYFNDSYKFASLDQIDGIITNEMPDAATCRTLYATGTTLY